MTSCLLHTAYCLLLRVQCVTGGDLGATTTSGQRVESGLERQLGLLRVPAASEARCDVLAPRDLHPETIEAERAWSKSRGIIALVTEAVACLARAATCAQRGPPLHRSVRRTNAGFRDRTAIQRQLTFVLSECLRHVCPLSKSSPNSQLPTSNAQRPTSNFQSP